MKYNFGLFSIVRDEARFLKEWLAYHFLPEIGVEHVYLHVQDEPNTPEWDATMTVTRPYVAAGLVSIVCGYIYRDPQWQLRAWGDLLHYYGHQCNWALLTDVDCFLFPVKQETVPAVLADILRIEESHLEPIPLAGVAVYTCTFGSNGLERTPAIQTEAFVRRASLSHPSNWTPNYILRPACVQLPTVKAGYRVPKAGYQVVDTSGIVVDGIKKRQGPLDRLRLNHYSVRSKEDWERKVARGWPDAAATWTDTNRTIAEHKLAMLDRNEEYDDSLPDRFGTALHLAMGL